MNAVETAVHIRLKKISAIQACSNHLRSESQTDRPGGATLPEVQDATVTAHENLNAVGTEVSELSRVDCPCVLLGAGQCHREDKQDPDASQ
jgi:hypothetical protein